MAQQIGFFGPAVREFVRTVDSRIAYYPEVISAEQSAQLFADLAGEVAWKNEQMRMYDRSVAVPRLIARFGPGDVLPPALLTVRRIVQQYLGAVFSGVSVQYYRSGSDSVAWHSDHTEDLIDRAIVAIVSLGAVREMRVRSKSRPRRSFSCQLEPGSLFVMSGRAQELWEHHIPKLRRPTGPRISAAFRQRREEAASP